MEGGYIESPIPIENLLRPPRVHISRSRSRPREMDRTETDGGSDDEDRGQNHLHGRPSGELRRCLVKIQRRIGEALERAEAETVPPDHPDFMLREVEAFDALMACLKDTERQVRHSANLREPARYATFRRILQTRGQPQQDLDGAGSAPERVGPDDPDLDYPSAETMGLVERIRADRSTYVHEARYNPGDGFRRTGETDVRFRPQEGDMVIRCRPLDKHGSLLEFYDAAALALVPLRAGDKVARVYLDNSSHPVDVEKYVELHLCLGHQGGPDPLFVFLGCTSAICKGASGP